MAVLQKGVVVRGYEWEVAASRVAKQVRSSTLAGSPASLTLTGP